MGQPDLIFVTGCNAAGKSSLIRTHLSLFPDYEVIMTDVYKSRSREGFKDLIDFSKNSGYQSTLIVLFLKSPAHSLERVAARRTFENGLFISDEDVEYNFIENFKNMKPGEENQGFQGRKTDPVTDCKTGPTASLRNYWHFFTNFNGRYFVAS